MRSAWSPDPGTRSQNARLVTGPVCPLYSCSVFPVCVNMYVSERAGSTALRADLQVEFADDLRVLRDPRDAVAHLDGERLPRELDGLAKRLRALRFLLSRLTMR